MKLIPCTTPKTKCRDFGWAMAVNGEPLMSARYVEVFKCFRCKQTQHMTPAEFNRLPRLTTADFKRLAVQAKQPHLERLPTRDLEGAGFTRMQAADLVDKGFTSEPDVESRLL